MKITSKFMLWLMGLTTLMRYFVIAVLFHVVILFILGSIRIVSEIPRIVAAFGGDSLPPPAKDDIDPFAALRDFEYNGPTLGGGGGTPGKGPGGVPTAAGPTELKASIADTKAADTQVAEVIGVVSESATAVARLQGSSLGGLSAPTTGFGDNKIGTAGIKGPGGGGFGQRMGPMRAQAISKNQGSMATEKAVLAALRWLKEHQETNGTWEPVSHPVGKTGLAVLCFLGHGETPDSDEFGPTVSKGLSYLANLIGPDGIIKTRDKNMYEQGIVTLALAEGYGMTKSPLAKEPLQRAVNAILESQKAKKAKAIHEGGWRYTPTSDSADTSVIGWQVMALKSARLAGISVPDEAFNAASKCLWNLYAETQTYGNFGYDHPNPAQSVGRATTAVGILCQQFMGHSDDKRIKKALDYYKEEKAVWDTGNGKASNSLYAWYYITQAMFQAGGNHWINWNNTIRKTLVDKQSADGHWDDPLPLIPNQPAQPVFSTTLCCLMLEVYYRYLPLYQEMERKSLPPQPVPGQSVNAG